MNRKQVISFVVLAAAAGGLAYANQGESLTNDAANDLGKAKISLVQAIGSAETQAGGKATRAELETERGSPAFSVEVVTADSKVFDVKVDAVDGKVLSSKADVADRGEKDDEDQDD